VVLALDTGGWGVLGST